MNCAELLKGRRGAEAPLRMLEYVARHMRCVASGECVLDVNGERLVCDEKSCWWEGAYD
jgi:hypothetical protein